jgi:drug/metabolite transporter (DMT)-like permease
MLRTIDTPAPITPRLGVTLALALVAFAANSILCREALLHTRTDAFSFTLARLGSGALVLALLTRILRTERGASERSPLGRRLLDGFWLLLYALPFSLAYRRLEAGTGALIMFGAVQLTMMLSAILAGERPSGREWFGLVTAFAGLAYLVSPGLHAPDPLGAAEMAAAGVGWGRYTLAGRQAHGSPLGRNAKSFLIAALGLAPMALSAWGRLDVDAHGLGLAVASGSVASGIGYALWYAALPRLSTTRAALSQLMVPVLAALGGVSLLGEQATLRLVLASVVVLGALALALSAPHPVPGRGGEEA